MRKYSLMRKIVSRMMALTVAAALMPAISVHAASEYTVTFRPGNVGQFGIASGDENAEKSVKEKAQEVADIYYAQYETTVTENGAIKVKVAAGADMPTVPGYIIPEAGYCVRSWGPKQGEKVTKNVDYVVDYGRLTDGVEYTVKYVDEESGESVAPFLTAYANIGDRVELNAPASIMTSAAGEYALTSEASCELTLTADADANVVVFHYAYRYEPGTVTEDVLVDIPGDTVVNTETITTYINNGTTVVPGAVIAGEEEQDADGNAEDEGEPNQDAEAPEVVDIEDSDTPLAGNSDEEDVEDVLVEIEEENAPLANFGSETAVIWAAVFGVAALALAIIWLQVRRRKNRVTEEEQQ